MSEDSSITGGVVTPLPPHEPRDPSTPAPSSGATGPDLAGAVVDMAGSIKVLVDSWAKRTNILIAFVAIASITLAAMLLHVSGEVDRNAKRVQALLERMESIQAQQTEIKEATREASDRAAEVAEAAPQVVTPEPAPSASSGKPAAPPRSYLLVPPKPGSSAAPQVIPLPPPVVSAPLEKAGTSSTGGAP